MKGSGKAGNGGNNRRRPAKRRDKDNRQGANGNDTPNAGGGNPRNFGGEKARGRQHHENQGRQNRSGFFKKGGENHRKEKPLFDRPKWVPPKVSTEPLPVPDCPWCGKPIKDISLALTDRESGAPVHFDCVSARIAGGEVLEKGEVITYIGGGRFGVVYFSGSGNSHPANRNFKIKKIIEWENKDKRAEWRSLICDRYSIT